MTPLTVKEDPAYKILDIFYSNLKEFFFFKLDRPLKTPEDDNKLYTAYCMHETKDKKKLIPI